MRTPRTNEQFIEAFAKHQKTNGRLNSLLIDGDTLYSYGYHYPLLMHITNDAVLINDEGYSPTTSKHIALAKRYSRDKKQLFVSELCLPNVLNKLEYLNTKLQKARKPRIYTYDIQMLYTLFQSGLEYMNGFYIKHKGYFTGTEFRLTQCDKATAEQSEQLKRMANIYANSLNY